MRQHGGDAGTEYMHPDVAPDNESKDNLLIACIGTSGLQYQDANQSMPYGSLGLCLPSIGAPAYTDEGESGWGSEWDKKGTSGGIGPGTGGSLLPMKEGGMSILGSTFCL